MCSNPTPVVSIVNKWTLPWIQAEILFHFYSFQTYHLDNFTKNAFNENGKQRRVSFEKYIAVDFTF